jgi:hypothetical protein
MAIEHCNSDDNAQPQKVGWLVVVVPGGGSNSGGDDRMNRENEKEGNKDAKTEGPPCISSILTSPIFRSRSLELGSCDGNGRVVATIKTIKRSGGGCY